MMRREIVIQLVLTALALLLLLIVLLFRQPKYVERYPEDVSVPPTSQVERSRSGAVTPGNVETSYDIRPVQPETLLR